MFFKSLVLLSLGIPLAAAADHQGEVSEYDHNGIKAYCKTISFSHWPDLSIFDNANNKIAIKPYPEAIKIAPEIITCAYLVQLNGKQCQYAVDHIPFILNNCTSVRIFEDSENYIIHSHKLNGWMHTYKIEKRSTPAIVTFVNSIPQARL
jgi:hypothetical protein